jgi:hypothetical protein
VTYPAFLRRPRLAIGRPTTLSMMWRICLGAGASASVRVERTRVQSERPEELTTFRPAQGKRGASCYLLRRGSKTGFSRGMHRNCTCEALRFSCGVLLYAAEGTAQSRRHWLLHPGAGQPGGTKRTPSLYRLSLTYCRDNRASDLGSHILRKAGISNPKHITLDLPSSLTDHQ